VSQTRGAGARPEAVNRQVVFFREVSLAIRSAEPQDVLVGIVRMLIHIINTKHHEHEHTRMASGLPINNSVMRRRVGRKALDKHFVDNCVPFSFPFTGVAIP
jgi:hypothetical protein